MKKSSFIILVLAMAVALCLGALAYGVGAFDDLSRPADDLIAKDGCSAYVSKEELSYREQCEKDWEERRKDPRPFDINDSITWYAEAKDGGLDEETAALAKAGMTVEEAVAVLGEPQRDAGSGVIIFEWDMKTGEILQVGFYKVKFDIVLSSGYGWESGEPRIYSPDEKAKK